MKEIDEMTQDEFIELLKECGATSVRKVPKGEGGFFPMTEEEEEIFKKEKLRENIIIDSKIKNQEKTIG
jgi:hypothetical protein